MAEEEQNEVANQITMIVTTSVGPTNPLTVFLEKLMSSYVQHQPELRRCRKIIVCDGENIIDGERYKAVHFRRGVVSEAASARYREYIRNIDELCGQAGDDETNPFFNCSTLCLEKRHGFALAVGRALDITKTPYVLVIQHDRSLRKSFGLARILKSLDSFAFRKVNYVLLGTGTTFNSASKMMGTYKVDVRDSVIKIPNTEMLIVPLVFWYDSTHVCRTSFYRDFALGSHHTNKSGRITWWKWRTGDFIEDKLGQIMMRRVSLVINFRCRRSLTACPDQGARFF
mmetsp:Transcript_6837/g.10826  ORF Transcript_6837/g.10826 Transcript_6837/m.10826 type:complete len:285 (+) Transcript_6837:87-941(+)